MPMVACNIRDTHSILEDGNYKICVDAIFDIAAKLVIFFLSYRKSFPTRNFLPFFACKLIQIEQNNSKIAFSKLLFHSI